MSENNSKSFYIYGIVIILFFVAIILFTSMGNNDSSKELSYNESIVAVQNGDVAEVRTYGDIIYGRYVEAKSKVSATDFEKKSNFKYDFYVDCGYSEVAVDLVKEWKTTNNVSLYKIEAVQASFLSTALPYIYIILFIILGIFVIRSFSKMSGKNMDFGKNKARSEQNLKVKFDDVAGCDEEKAEMQEIVEFLKNPKKFTDLGARIPKGVLLVGPPGTGKTLLAKAIAGEAGVPFFSITGSDFVEMFVGVGAARVRDLFDTAKKNMPCLIFIDEIDAVGRHRGTGIGNTNDEREQTLNQLLVQMDGFESSDGIVVIAATNRPDVLDPALLRAGRFDRQIVVNTPDVGGREKILRLYAKGKPFSDKINFASVARILSGCTGADIETILNEAAILAARDNRALITQSDIMEAISKSMMGPQKRSRIVKEEEKISTAYHESGHAIIARSCENLKDEVQEVSIIPRGMAGGYTSYNSVEDITQYSKEQMLDSIRNLMGGRAAEIIKTGKIGTGASNDIKRATDIARSMVTEYGMSEKLGPVCYTSGEQMFLGRDMQTHNSFSNKVAEMIDDEVKSILENALNEAIAILKKKKNILENMAAVLLEKETIYSQDVDALMEGKSKEFVVEQIDKRDKEHEEEDKKARDEKMKRDAELARIEKERLEILRNSALAAFNGEIPNTKTTEQPKAVDAKEESKKEDTEQKSTTIVQEPKQVKQTTEKKETKTTVKKGTTQDTKKASSTKSKTKQNDKK